MVQPSGISQLDHRDASVVRKMHSVFQRSYRKEAELIGVKDFPPLQRTMHNLKEADTQFFGYWVNGDLAAVTEVAEHATELRICSLVVDPGYFRKGLASQLLNYVLELIVWETVVVETAVANSPAIALYKKFGFSEEKRWKAAHGIRKVLLRAKTAQ